ncbi:hypothetical protein [Actinoplanes teichomyceticus]|uniref:Uncharacterized protein n=1 Tax=Actinoplanes teichomyceticus TaxID=1867 RepID=A0A561VSW2_ACTTI|nr:hypothetical protein [Actinoplanes teichomyceticus]TWG14704.1 hypothetical protein FHX34_1041010 [Actinoplanes teichomyceticus]GIF10107.1 hypothetical protein Ate01nite_01390 [Actinoplanes teichomyceticus]
MRLSDEQLRAALRAEAAAHRPDREAMLARITAGAMTGPAAASRSARRRGGPRLRLAAVGALVALFGGGGFAAQWALAGDQRGDETAPAPTPTISTVAPSPSTAGPSTAPSATGSRPTAPATTRPATRTPGTTAATASAPTTAPAVPAPAKGAPGNTRVEQGPLWSDGSIDPDSGDTRGGGVITLKTTEKLTALTVTVRVARTPGLTSRGGTKSVPGASVSVGVTERADALLYTFTLAPADEIAPGTYTFTAKYAYDAGGRNAGGDTYEAVATTAGGRSLDVYGNFYPS